ncbi:hypothetical protein C0J52_03512 [Blattella germanica]|nr:hypothetical protein C0J52_03512 [Blattella germanica]
MEVHDDKNGVKDRILDDLGKSIKLVRRTFLLLRNLRFMQRTRFAAFTPHLQHLPLDWYPVLKYGGGVGESLDYGVKECVGSVIQRYALCGYEGVVVIGNDSWLVQSLCHLLDLLLRHGLRDHHRGYWPIVREFSHSDTLQIIQSLKSVNTSLGKGRAWLYYTLTEGSLQSYLHCLCRDVKVLHRYYVTQALLRDTSRTQQLLTLLAGLEQVQFNLDPDVAYLDMAAYQQQHSEVSSDLLPSCGDPSNLGPRMTSSITSSLASPVDSGVALLDSDADATSVSEATINETDSSSLRDDKEDDSTFNEIEDNRINQLLSLEVVSKKHIESPREESECCSIGNFQNPDDLATPNSSDVLETSYAIESTSHRHEGAFGCEYSSDCAANCAKEEILSARPAEFSEVPVRESEVAGAVSSPVNEAIVVPDVFRSRTFSIMTASDIANQNVGEDSVMPSDIHSSDDFVESKNRVNRKLNILEDTKGHQTDKIKTEPDVVDKQSKPKGESKMKSDTDDIVYRRQRSKKKRNNAGSSSSVADSTTKVKRVSFHEDFINNECDSNRKCQPNGGTEFSVSFLPPDSVIKRDAVKGRYSWCGEGDAPFVRRRNNESDTKSDVYLSSSTLTSSSNETICVDEQISQSRENNKTPPSSSNNVKYQKPCRAKERHAGSEASQTPPVAERGTPEGQEDPPNSASNLCLHSDLNRKQSISGNLPEAMQRLSGNLKKFPSFSSSVDWTSDTESIPASDTEFVCSRTGHLISSSFKENYFPGNLSSSSSLLDVRPSKPRIQNRSRKSTTLGLLPSKDVASKTSLLNRFMKSLTEKKFVKRKPKVLLRPSRSLYIPGTRKLDRAEVLEHFKTELDANMRLTGDIAQVCQGSVELEETFRAQVFLDSTEVLYKVYKVSSSYSVDGIGRPLLAILTNVNLYLTGVRSNYSYCNHLVLPYTELDAMLVGPNYQTVLLVGTNRQKQFLVVTGNRTVTENLVGHIELAMRRAPLKPTLPADEAIYYYSLVHLQDDHVSPPTTPMGPTKEGHLMFRPATDAPLQPWEPGFFMLKAGVVYMFGDKAHRLPKRVIPLRGNGCRGCRRIPYAQRPHTFEILLGPRRSFQFAAADEYEASDWLQAFVQAASGVYEEEKINVVPSSLVVTERHLVTCQETFPSSASSGSGQEFACREVHENSGDWVLYFTSADEMCNFKYILQQLWLSLQQTDFPLSPLADESLGRRCAETSSLLRGAWNILLPLESQASL